MILFSLSGAVLDRLDKSSNEEEPNMAKFISLRQGGGGGSAQFTLLLDKATYICPTKRNKESK